MYSNYFLEMYNVLCSAVQYCTVYTIRTCMYCTVYANVLYRKLFNVDMYRLCNTYNYS